MGRVTDTACVARAAGGGAGEGEVSTVVLAVLTGFAGEQVSQLKPIGLEPNAQIAVSLSSLKNLAWAVWLAGNASGQTKFA